MDGVRYSLLFEGKIAQGFTQAQVRENFSRLFKVDGERLERLFGGRPVFLKKDIDGDTLARFTRVLDRAGAIYTIDPPLSPAAPATQTTIIDCTPQQEDLRYSPQPCPRITGHAGGIDFNRNDIRRVAFENIRLVCTFAEETGPDETPVLLFFIDGSLRPYWIPANKISFGDFVNPVGTPSMKQSIQHFIDFLRLTNPRMAIDRPTGEFLTTGTIPILDKSPTRYATGLAQALGRTQPDKAQNQAIAPTPPHPTGLDGAKQSVNANTRHPAAPSMKLAPAQSATTAAGTPADAADQGTHLRASAADFSQDKAEPVLQVDPMSWSSLFGVCFISGLYVLVIVGILKAPNIFYDFLVSHFHINGQRLKFDDPWILLRTTLYQLPIIPLSIPFLYNVYLIEDVSSGYVVLMPLTLALAALGGGLAAIVFVNSLLTNITYQRGRSPFEPLFEGNSLPAMLDYIRHNPGEFVRIVLSGVCVFTLILTPLGIALLADVLMKRLLVDGYRYRVRIPWGDAVLWCVLSYVSAFLGLFRYVGILYEQVFPNGSWVRDRSAPVDVTADSAGLPQEHIRADSANTLMTPGITAPAVTTPLQQATAPAPAAVMSPAMLATARTAPQMTAVAPKPAQPAPVAASSAPGAVVVMGGEQTPRRFWKPLPASVVVIAAIAGAVLLFSRMHHGSPYGFKDVPFGTSIHAIGNLEKVELDNPIARINAMMQAGGTGNKFTDLLCMSYAGVNRGLSLSPLFYYDMYYRTDDDLQYAGRELWDIFYGFKDDRLVYVRIYPKNQADYNAIRESLRKTYGEASDVKMHHYPTLLSLAWQWCWEDDGVAIRVVAPATKNYDEMDRSMLKEHTEKVLKPYEIPEEFSRKFIEFIGDPARVRVDALTDARS